MIVNTCVLTSSKNFQKIFQKFCNESGLNPSNLQKAEKGTQPNGFPPELLCE